MSQLVRTMYAARRLALARAVAEGRALGGDGIVGVELRVGDFPAGGLEFTALGTAVRARSRIRPRLPFTSHLSGQDFAKLIHARWVPTGLAFGICLETRHDDWRTSRLTPWTAGNGGQPPRRTVPVDKDWLVMHAQRAAAAADDRVGPLARWPRPMTEPGRGDGDYGPGRVLRTGAQRPI
ncbi:heavy metal-binding domain-containing protein [Streptomyces katrae]|uniref:heavy metal-binding domain-containing protein n=1 Tax=Streptomyces katrae TaxID=68223 RepID=UPI00131C3E64|nr:heavy metal-binding domain-containing protein [Streptomyces katrae]